MNMDLFIVLLAIIGVIVVKEKRKRQLQELETEILNSLGFHNWNIVPYSEVSVIVKSRKALENYDAIKFFKDNREQVSKAEKCIRRKNKVTIILREFLESNEYQEYPQYDKVVDKINSVLRDANGFRIEVTYISSAGNNLGSKEIMVTEHDINKIINDPTLLMSKGEYNKYMKEQQKVALESKQHEYYECVNEIIDYANTNKDKLVIKGDHDKLDRLISQLFDRTVNSIKKIKNLDSEEWLLIKDFISNIKIDAEKIVDNNLRILDYYESTDFLKIKDTCEALMDSQREFNEYINEKIQSISQLFGTRVVRNETVNEDEHNYIRPYKKTITPFTAEVSATVFASAENNPMEYIAKYFYPNKKQYPEQIKKLYQLVEELETLSDAKQIIDNYKVEYKQYLGDVPDFIMDNDEDGFYARLGFATIDESVLAVEYKFAYTSGGGMAQRYFTVPMTEDTIAELIAVLESKLTAAAFAKEQRTLMTKKLRDFIKTRDNFTCCTCGNSTLAEPNLLLEIDHIIPVSKGGKTEESNLQTLCWKCNRSKSDKILV